MISYLAKKNTKQTPPFKARVIYRQYIKRVLKFKFKSYHFNFHQETTSPYLLFTFHLILNFIFAESPSSVSSVQDLRRGGRRFGPRHGQYSFRGLMIVIATRFIPLSKLSIDSTMVIWESSQWLGRIIVQSTG